MTTPRNTAITTSQVIGSDLLTTTLRIGTGVRNQARSHAEKLGISLKDFTEGALLYFVRYGLNPAEVNKSQDLPKEVNRLRNHLFAFHKTQEEKYLVPMLRETYALAPRLEGLHHSLAETLTQLQNIHLLLYKIKIIQDISLSTTYILADHDEAWLRELISRNKERFDAEVAKFEKIQAAAFQPKEQDTEK